MSVRQLICALALAILIGGGAIGVAVAEPSAIGVASFNIQFLGNSTQRDNAALAGMLKRFDLVFVQELVSPPFAGTFPDGSPYRPDAEAAAFFNAMRELGFDYVLSPEDTGRGRRNHRNGSSTEWYVAFYRPEVIEPAPDLPHGFLAEDLTSNPDYDRVPFAFAFEAGSEDLVFVSVHLRPGARRGDARRRAHELTSIWDWIDSRQGAERDYVILGDMNIEDCDELAEVVPVGAVSLNQSCERTNTSVEPRPYDHVIFRARDTEAEIPIASWLVLDLVEEMRASWTGPGAYPGDPYAHDAFRARYSDHDPITFKVVIDSVDDD